MVKAAPDGAVTARKNVTVDGVLDGDDEETSFVIQGQQMIVNGLISVPELDMQGANQQTITGSGSMDLHNLSLDAPGNVFWAIPVHVDASLSLNTNLYGSNVHPLTLSESAVITGENTDKDIFGTVQRSGPFQKDKAYGFGNRYLALVFTSSDSTLPTRVAIAVDHTPWDNLPGSANRRVSIQSSGGSGWTANLTLDYRDSELYGQEDYLQAWKRLSASDPWEHCVYTQMHVGQNWVEFDGLTHFSDWGLSVQAVFLPLIQR